MTILQKSLANGRIVVAQKDPSKTRDILKSGIIPEEDRYLLPALPPQLEVAAATGPGGVGASGDFSRGERYSPTSVLAAYSLILKRPVPHQHQRMRGQLNGRMSNGRSRWRRPRWTLSGLETLSGRTIPKPREDSEDYRALEPGSAIHDVNAEKSWRSWIISKGSFRAFVPLPAGHLCSNSRLQP